MHVALHRTLWEKLLHNLPTHTRIHAHIHTYVWLSIALHEGITFHCEECVCVCVCVCVSVRPPRLDYKVASVCRINKIIGLFCKRALYKRQYSAKETYNFIDPTDRSQLFSWILYGVTTSSRLLELHVYRFVLQQSPAKGTIFCKRPII